MRTLFTIPAEGTFKLELSQVIQSQGCFPVTSSVSCEFHYIWDFTTEMGIAQLLDIGGTEVVLLLHPVDFDGALRFMSDMEPTTFTIKGVEVVIYRVILDLSLDGAHACALMFGESGNCIQASAAWDVRSVVGLDELSSSF